MIHASNNHELLNCIIILYLKLYNFVHTFVIILIDSILLRHKVIYSSRTHSQLSQAVAELSRTSYRYMKVDIMNENNQSTHIY